MLEHTAKIATAFLAVPSCAINKITERNPQYSACLQLKINSPYVSSDDGSELNFSFPEDPSDDNGEGCLHDDSLEPVVTEKEVAGYK